MKKTTIIFFFALMSFSANAQTTLPVIFNSFTASYSSKQITCTWITDHEINNQYFEVEASTDGVNFIVVDRIEKVNNTSTVSTYTSTFGAVKFNSSLIYCRIKQVDNGGLYMFSKTIGIKVLATNNTAASIFPNPFNNKLSINVEATINATATIQIYSTSGTKVLSQQKIVEAGFNSLQVDNTVILSSGVYIIKVVINDATVAIQKIIKQ